jgi:hypothetical protein
MDEAPMDRSLPLQVYENRAIRGEGAGVMSDAPIVTIPKPAGNHSMYVCALAAQGRRGTPEGEAAYQALIEQLKSEQNGRDI